MEDILSVEESNEIFKKIIDTKGLCNKKYILCDISVNRVDEYKRKRDSWRG